jgi:hypothetical protein
MLYDFNNNCCIYDFLDKYYKSNYNFYNNYIFYYYNIYINTFNQDRTNIFEGRLTTDYFINNITKKLTCKKCIIKCIITKYIRLSFYKTLNLDFFYSKIVNDNIFDNDSRIKFKKEIYNINCMLLILYGLKFGLTINYFILTYNKKKKNFKVLILTYLSDIILLSIYNNCNKIIYNGIKNNLENNLENNIENNLFSNSSIYIMKILSDCKDIDEKLISYINNTKITLSNIF